MHVFCHYFKRNASCLPQIFSTCLFYLLKFSLLIQPVEIFIDDESKLCLHGLQQYYVKLAEAAKNRKLIDCLDALDFNQVVIFVKSVRRCNELTKVLQVSNFPAMAVHSGLDQNERYCTYFLFLIT